MARKPLFVPLFTAAFLCLHSSVSKPAAFAKRFLLVSCLVYVGAVSADPKDFSMCDGLSGAEWGLCRAGVAASCADGSGNASACEEIEETYTAISGSPPPWSEVECPCDYSLVPKTLEVWDVGGGSIRFSCPVDPDGVRTIFLQSFYANSLTGVINSPGNDAEGYTDYCSALISSSFVGFAEDLTREEREACTASGLEYGRALKALFPTQVDDLCTGTF